MWSLLVRSHAWIAVPTLVFSGTGIPECLPGDGYIKIFTRAQAGKVYGR